MKQMELFIKLRKEKFLGRGAIKMREASDTSAPWVRFMGGSWSSDFVYVCACGWGVIQ